MTNKSKAKGTAFETDVVRFMQDNGLPYAERRALHGAIDLGDITGIPGWVFECKNHAKMTLGEWMNEGEREAFAARCTEFAVVHKRKMRSVRDAFFTVPLHIGCELVRSYEAVSE